jgi:hypothetical protein
VKPVSRIVIGVLCAGLCTGVCAGQTETPPTTAAAANDTKSVVQGKVVQEPGGQGLRKVRVILSDSHQWQEQYEATTDETGQFKIEGMKPAVYQVRLLRSGYVQSGKTNRERTITVSAWVTKEWVLHMQVAGVISGKIVDPDGDPLRGVRLEAIANNSGGAGRNEAESGYGATNDLGEFRIPDLMPGRYIVQATLDEGRWQQQAPPPRSDEKGALKGQLVYAMTYFPGTMDERQAGVVEVSAGETATANFAVQTSEAYRVSGTVVGLQEQHKGAVLFLVGKNGQKYQQLGQGGKFEFSGVLAGTYRAMVTASLDLGNRTVTSRTMRTTNTPIEVNGADVVGLQLQVDRGGNVSGQFHEEGDEKISWAELYAALLPMPESEEEEIGLEGMERAAGAQVNADGSFQIKDVSGGNWQLAVAAGSEQSRDCYTKSVLLSGREVVDTGFSVSSGTVLDVVVSPKGARIAGFVEDGDRKPVARAMVVTIPSSGKLERPDAYQEGLTNEHGYFELRGMNPGAFVVLAFEDRPENYRSAEFARKYEGKGEKVELEEGGKKGVVVKLITEEGNGP